MPQSLPPSLSRGQGCHSQPDFGTRKESDTGTLDMRLSESGDGLGPVLQSEAGQMGSHEDSDHLCAVIGVSSQGPAKATPCQSHPHTCLCP